jgi:hypothetical protein
VTDTLIEDYSNSQDGRDSAICDVFYFNELREGIVDFDYHIDSHQ